MVLGAAQGLHALAVRAAGGVDVFGNGGGAHKADGFDQRVRQQRVHGFLVAVDHVEHARWQTGFKRQFGNAQGARRVALRGLQDEAVAAGHGHGPHPQGHHGGEVEGRDAGGHTQGLEFAPRINGGADVFAVLALEQFGGIRGVFHVFNAALQLAHGVAHDLAVFGGDHGADLVGVGLKQHLEVAHDARALERRRVAPGGESGLCVGNGLFDSYFVGQQHTLFGLAGGGVKNVSRAGAALGQFAANEVANGRKCGHRRVFQVRKNG